MEKAKLGNVSSRKTIFPETVSAYGPCIISSLVSQKTMRLKKKSLWLESKHEFEWKADKTHK